MTDNKQHTQLHLYNNSWYKPGQNRLILSLWYYCNIVLLKNTLLPFSSLKIGLLRLFGASIAHGVVLKPGISVKYPWLLTIGNDSWIGENVWIDNLAAVTIGNNVCISQGAMLQCGNHNYTSVAFDLVVKPITIEDGVWIGTQSVVCPGVTCFSHAVLAAGSIVSSNMEAYTIYKGNPAIPFKTRHIQP